MAAASLWAVWGSVVHRDHDELEGVFGDQATAEAVAEGLKAAETRIIGAAQWDTSWYVERIGVVL